MDIDHLSIPFSIQIPLKNKYLQRNTDIIITNSSAGATKSVCQGNAIYTETLAYKG